MNLIVPEVDKAGVSSSVSTVTSLVLKIDYKKDKNFSQSALDEYLISSLLVC